MMLPDMQAAMQQVEESRRNFIATRMQKFGETEEVATALYERLVFALAVKALPKALALLRASLK